MNRDAETNAIAPTTTMAVFMFTDIAGSTALKERMGTAAYVALLRQHNDCFRQILAQSPGAIELENPGDGFLARFPTDSAAVEASLRFQHALRAGPWDGERLGVRIGLHVGEVAELSAGGETQEKFVGTALDLAARVESLATPGQILMTRPIFDSARQHVRRHPDVGDAAAPPLSWMAHGPYLFKGSDDPVDVFEVGVPGLAPLAAPPDVEKAHRLISPEEQEMLGWRPAAGLEVPMRQGWTLRDKLGEGGFGEVWVGVQARVQDVRVFKFCFDAERLRHLKRELTLFRLIRSALGDRRDIARLYEVQLERPPYFLESEFTEEGDLKTWAKTQGGINTVPLETRLDFLARTADAVAAAHSVGVLHKDIKPSNVLVSLSSSGAPRPRLADFGIGAIADRSRIESAGITVAGFTQSLVEATHSSLTGTQMYAPPETLAGRPFTVQGDIYALGILLYQLVVGDLDRPLGQGWERDVDDPFLREDIGACVDVDPARRPRGADELADRLRRLDERRAARAREVEQRDREARRSRLRRAGAIAAAALVVAAAGLVGLVLRERTLRDRAQRQADIALATSAFLDDMLTAPNPFLGEADSTAARDIRVVDVLDDAAATVGARYADAPHVEASVRLTLARTYQSLGAYEEALIHAQRAVELRQRHLDARDPDRLAAEHALANVLADLGRFQEAEALYGALVARSQEVFGASDSRTLHAMIDRGRALQAAGAYEDAETALALAWKFAATLGPDDEMTLIAKEAMAQLYVATIRMDEADRLFTAILDQRKDVLGPQHPTTLRIATAQTYLRQLQGRLDEAIAMSSDIVRLTTEALGPDHPVTLGRRHQLAELYRQAARYDEAAAIYVPLLEANRARLGEDHVRTQIIMNDLANLYGDTGDYARAAELHEGSLRIIQRLLGEDHPDAITNLSNLGRDYERLGRLDEAEAMQVKALTLRQEALGEDNAWTHSSYSLVGEIYRLRDRLDEAAAMHVTGLDGARTSLGPSHWYTGIMLRRYGHCLLDQKKYDDAEQTLLDAHAALLAAFGEDDFRAQTVVELLIQLYDEWQRPDDRDAWRARLVASSE